ncbi:MAG: pilus assembly protein PilM [Lachnospiraceae bacterium]|nr:pilus assembly protein PilM [Lachnospiraceae bacterium]
MASKVLSIEIGANYTRICQTDYKVKSPRVYGYAKVETPDNILMDGEVQATPEFVNLIKETIKANKLTAKQVVFPITSSKVATREVTIPYVREKQIDALIRANIKDYFPIDLSQHELGFIQLSENQANNERKVLLLAVPRLILDSYKKLADALGLQMVAADYSGNSIYEMVKNDCKDGVKMVIKVDEDSSIITIVENSTISLQRNIAYGINDAINTIVNNPAFEASSYDDALDLAARKTCMKVSINAKELREAEEEDASDDARLLSAKKEVSASLNMLLNGVARIQDYYGSRNGGRTVDNIYITGLGADFSGLSKLFTNELGIKTVGLKHLEGHTIEKAFKDGRFGEYIACVGAAVNPVGFMTASSSEVATSSAKSASGSKSYLAVGILVGILGCAIAGGLFGIAFMHQQEAKTRHNNDVQKLNELSEIRTIYATHESIKVVHDQVETMYGLTSNHNEELLDFLAEMEKKLPADVSVQTFSAVLDSVTMTMKVSSKEEMANAIQELRNFDSIGDVQIAGATDTTDAEGVPSVIFTITCIYESALQ